MFPIVLYPNSTKEMEELCLLVLVPTTEILVLWKHCTWPQIEHNALFNDTDAEIAISFNSVLWLQREIKLYHFSQHPYSPLEIFFNSLNYLCTYFFIYTFVWYILLWFILLFWSLLLNWCFFAFGFISFSRDEVIIC